MVCLDPLRFADMDKKKAPRVWGDSELLRMGGSLLIPTDWDWDQDGLS
jgi:hypothetical protein